MTGQRFAADKPRRALPAAAVAHAGRFRGLLRRGVTVVVVSGIAAAGLVAFTTSSANSAGVAFADARAFGVAGTARAGTPTTLNELAQVRTEQITTAGDQINDSVQDAALAARSSALVGGAKVITTENKRLKTLTKFLWPTAGGVGSPYGMRLHPILHYYRMHDGSDIGGKCGQPIYAAQSGTVVRSFTDGYNGGAGHYVRLDHGDINGVNVQTGYLHMDEIKVKVGDKVDKGDLLGTVGNTGLSTACHLHFSAYENGSGINPMKYVGWNPEANRKGDPDAVDNLDDGDLTAG